MIEKICEELAVLHVKSEFRPVFEREVRQKALMEAMNIVREVAKEYESCEVMRSNCEVAKDGGWIPCSERLPNKDENRKYLVCGKNGGIYIAEFVCKSVSNNTSICPWWSASGRYCPSPIAWQPLPAPYQKGE